MLKPCARWLFVGLMSAQIMFAQFSSPAPAPAPQWSDTGILSDTQGFDFGPYLAQIRGIISANWQAQLPKEVIAGKTGGVVLIRATILSDGKVANGSMHLEGRSGRSGRIELDRAAWQSIATAQLPPLPEGFKGNRLELRIRFRCNETQEQADATPLGKLPAAATLVYVHPLAP